MKLDIKNLGIGTGIGAGVAALALNAPKIAKATKEKMKGARLNRSLKRRSKDEKSTENSTPEEK